MVNHAAAGLKTLNESVFQGRGVNKDLELLSDSMESESALGIDKMSERSSSDHGRTADIYKQPNSTLTIGLSDRREIAAQHRDRFGGAFGG